MITNMISKLRRSLSGNFLLISYKKITNVPDIDAGYIDVDTVAKRYYDSSISLKIKDLLANTAIKDAIYFIENDCNLSFSKFSKNKLLDVGCGSGVYSKVFSRKESVMSNYEYFGCEIDKRIVDVCKRINPDKSFFVSLANQISKPDDSFNLVFCSGTLHYTLKGWKDSLQEMERVSSKYIALMRLPVSKYNKTFYVKQIVKGVNGTENHFFVVINREELENYIKSIGLKVVNRDYSYEEYRIEGVEERIILSQYLLEKS